MKVQSAQRETPGLIYRHRAYIPYGYIEGKKKARQESVIGSTSTSVDRRSASSFNVARIAARARACFLTTEEEYERAVNSFQLDESLMASIANLTGDLVFRSWTPLRLSPWLAIHRDVARDLYWHALVHEYAHGLHLHAGWLLAFFAVGVVLLPTGVLRELTAVGAPSPFGIG